VNTIRLLLDKARFFFFNFLRCFSLKTGN